MKEPVRFILQRRFARALFLAVAVGGAVLPPILAPAVAQAASFNCRHAALPAEVAICDNANLGRLDEQVAGMYFLIVSSAPEETVSQVKSMQGKFLTRRNSCEANIDCLVSAYTDQIMYLKNMKGDLGL